MKNQRISEHEPKISVKGKDREEVREAIRYRDAWEADSEKGRAERVEGKVRGGRREVVRDKIMRI